MKGDLRRSTAVLFIVGSVCFLVGPLPFYLDLVGPRWDAATFFVGSLFFTSAATLQWITSKRVPAGSLDLWSSGVQLAGTVFFNVSTFWALTTSWSSSDYDKLVWRPDAFGSTCFLVSGYLAYLVAVGGLFKDPRGRPGAAMAGVNLFGCVAFGVAAVAAYVIPGTSTDVDTAVANAGTAVGALGFLIGAALLLRSARQPSVTATSSAAT